MKFVSPKKEQEDVKKEKRMRKRSISEIQFHLLSLEFFRDISS